jgi:L-methionine (R)-S-oxide reductase
MYETEKSNKGNDGMNDTKILFDSILEKVEEILERPSERDEKLSAICSLLQGQISHYDWVGFYLVDQENKRELVLGPYIGEPTDHVRIPFGRGICGQAGEREETFVIQDVSKETNYLSCSSKVKSEIVVPIFRDGEVVGELDIDSYTISPFTDEERKFLEQICVIISDVF